MNGSDVGIRDEAVWREKESLLDDWHRAPETKRFSPPAPTDPAPDLWEPTRFRLEHNGTPLGPDWWTADGFLRECPYGYPGFDSAEFEDRAVALSAYAEIVTRMEATNLPIMRIGSAYKPRPRWCRLVGEGVDPTRCRAWQERSEIVAEWREGGPDDGR